MRALTGQSVKFVHDDPHLPHGGDSTLSCRMDGPGPHSGWARTGVRAQGLWAFWQSARRHER